jgi:2-polyprenyl-6-methoxyphenol hydroxylase-like FAD-dependent oxidoreductase
MMLGLLLARSGINVIVLEKHTNFFRDFRGDTIHPSTLDLIDQLGLRHQFDAVPQTAVSSLDMVLNGTRLRPVDFRHLPGRNREIVLMPQWDFLDLLADEAARLPHFRLIFGAGVTGVISHEGRVSGVTADTADGPIEVHAPLTVAADGRASTVRAAAGLPVQDFGVAVDVLWFRVPKPADNPPSTLGYLDDQSMIITIPRLDYYQTAMLIPKGGFDEIQAQGLPKFRESVVHTAPFLAPTVSTLQEWDDVKLLSVQVNRLHRWYLPGLLCIGDAAHAMSPAFGVGINYAIQDAVATANRIAGPLAAGTLTTRDLRAVQRRRQGPVRLMQSIQLRLHKVIGRPGGGAILPAPLPAALRVTLAVVLPVVRRVAARVVGRGFRVERIRVELLARPPIEQWSPPED